MSVYKKRWNKMVVLLVVYNCFYLPFAAAFLKDVEETDVSTTVEYAIDFLFVIDILFCFRTAFVSTHI